MKKSGLVLKRVMVAFFDSFHVANNIWISTSNNEFQNCEHLPIEKKYVHIFLQCF